MHITVVILAFLKEFSYWLTKVSKQVIDIFFILCYTLGIDIREEVFTYMNIGSKIKRLRSKAGLTQDQLASRLGISGQSVSKWETSVTMPDICLLPSLAGELGVSIDELFDLTVEQKLHRIARGIDVLTEFSPETFAQHEEFLLQQLDEYRHLMSNLYFASLYHTDVNQ